MTIKSIPAGQDLATSHPELAAQWHPTKNDTLTPSEITAGSSKKVWWQCAEGHEWEAIVNNRTKGRGCRYCAGNQVLPGYNDLLTVNPQLAAQWHDTKNTLTPSEVMPNANRKFWWQCEQGHEWEATANNRSSGKGCPYCAGRKASAATWSASVKSLTRQDGKHTGCPECSLKLISCGEQELADWLTGLGVVVQQNERDLIAPHELDLYLPEYKFAIEFNGLYWHSEAVRQDKNYHLKKVQTCDAVGVVLFQVWEDDWRDRKEIVKRMISHRLGLSDSPVVYARKTDVVHLSSAQARSFLEQNHIQGHATGRLYLGLNDKRTQDLVAVMVLKVMPHGVYLERYATACRVPGGFTKLLKQAIAELAPQQIITFADRSVSQGGLYESNGFVVDSLLAPDYSYLVRGSRVHKFNYRLKRFREDPNLQYEEGLSETQLARLNKLHRIWDSGKTRYVLEP